MIPGKTKPYTKAEFRAGMTCGVVGCTRLARHEWHYPCAINTMLEPNSPGTRIALCDECDLEMNRKLLEVVGVPPHILELIMQRYKSVQGDMALT